MEHVVFWFIIFVMIIMVVSSFSMFRMHSFIMSRIFRQIDRAIEHEEQLSSPRNCVHCGTSVTAGPDCPNCGAPLD